ncbi:MAG: hypothetical protein A2W99_00555 [Bacteroidetes bacterium GWF2_33_16]|nr:MAG: hypothetical protein A2X00_03260 [Bacteroidetes bacterium GWE2_32_14]OFY08762.1 MAG: hypothetical protein A2W99_00555 [Bacteroidetes bacterium GWF2_33_16]
MKRDKNYYQKIYDLKSWQGFHVNQLGYIRNLILVLSTAVLGFTVKLLINESVTDSSDILAIKITCGLLFGSIISGILMAIFESENYKLKYKIGRMLENKSDFDQLPDDIEKKQNCCDCFELINKILLYSELTMFAVAVGILTFIFF